MAFRASVMNGRIFQRRVLFFLVGAFLGLLLELGAPVGRAFFLPPLYPSPNERLGYGVTHGIENVPTSILSQLQAGWYVNWGSAPNAPHPNGLRYVQIIRLTPTSYVPRGEELRRIILKNPGSLWLVGNEPDSIYQDNQTPEQYVEKYHEIYTFIKRVDPSARVAIGGVIQATPLRLRYLDLIWAKYRERYGMDMPVDVWNVHNFILREARVYCSPGGVWGAYIPPGLPDNCGEQYAINDHDNMTIFRRQIYAFRRWMKEKGQQNKPLIVSEYGILFPEELGFTEQRVERFMLATFDFFMNARDPDLGYLLDDGRLVQQWAWFSLDETSFEWGTTHSALYDPVRKELTPLGKVFRAYATQQRVPYKDPYLAAPHIFASTPVPFGGVGEVTIEVPVLNDGNTLAEGTVYLEQLIKGGEVKTVGEQYIADIPSRYRGARIIRFRDRGLITHTLQYRARLIAPDDIRPGNNQAKGILELDISARRFQVASGYSSDGQVGTIHASITVSNATDIPFTAVPFRIEIADQPHAPLLAGTIDLLPAKGRVTVTVSWQQPVGERPVRLLIDPANIVQEANETNNMLESVARVVTHRALLPLCLH